MRDVLTGRSRLLGQSLDGLFHEAQPPSSIAVAAEQIGSKGRPLVEPGSLFVDGNYALQISSWNSLAGVSLELRSRFLNTDGTITDTDAVHTPNSNRTKATSLVPLSVGFPLNVMLFASAGSPLIGQTFVQVQIVRGFSGALLPVATILQGYVTAAQAVAWPGTPIQSSIEGGGYVRTIIGATPSAATDITETVPTGARWELVSLRYTLTTSAVAGNRGQLLYFGLAGVPYAYSISTALFGPSLLVGFGYGQGQPVGVDGFTQVYNAPLPIANRLLGGMTITSVTNQIKAGDQLSAPFYVVNEWLEAA